VERVRANINEPAFADAVVEAFGSISPSVRKRA
jgi:uncharacterized protein (UPF0261 family)